MARTYSTAYMPRWVIDQDSLDMLGGGQINWSNVGSGFVNAGTGLKELPAGTIMAIDSSDGRLYIDAAEEATNGASAILLTDAVEGERHAAISGYGFVVGGVIRSNYLPDRDSASFATWLGELNAAGVGAFVFRADGEDTSDPSSA